ncbi:MAG TPA: hypothetical protein PKW73_12170, partial [Candidatus Obscuribacter sp.]|nr:hypothetical protein [Candidatus Obscuribacter sp.]
SYRQHSPGGNLNPALYSNLNANHYSGQYSSQFANPYANNSTALRRAVGERAINSAPVYGNQF